MKKALAAFAGVVVFVLLGLKLAVKLGYVGSPSTEQLGAESIRAMEEYCALVAEVRTPQDATAVEAKEPLVRTKGLEAGRRYSQKVLEDRSGKKETRDRFQELSERFLNECKRYDAMLAKARQDRPKP